MPRVELEFIDPSRSGEGDYFAAPGYIPPADRTIMMDQYQRFGKGVQALRGLSGLGLPPVALRAESLREGSRFRNRRVLDREIDIVLDVTADERDELKSTLMKLSWMLSDECVFRLYEDDSNAYWYTRCYLSGGGNYVYGEDTDGETEMSMVITVRSMSPYLKRGGAVETVQWITNFCGNPIFESGTDGWSVTGDGSSGIIYWETANPISGVGSLKVVATTPGGATGIKYDAVGDETAGDTIVARCSIRNDGTVPQQFQLRLFESDNFPGRDTADVVVQPGQVLRASVSHVKGSDTSSRLAINGPYDAGGGAPGDTFTIDNVMIGKDATDLDKSTDVPVVVDSFGDAPVEQVWKINGPLTQVRMTNGPKENVGYPAFEWNGSLAADEWLEVDTARQTVTRVEADGTRTNAYDGLATAPLLWKLPARTSWVFVSATGNNSTTIIRCEFRPRRALVI